MNWPHDAAKPPAARAALLATILKTGRYDRTLQQLQTVPKDPSILRALRIEPLVATLLESIRVSSPAPDFQKDVLHSGYTIPPVASYLL